MIEVRGERLVHITYGAKWVPDDGYAWFRPADGWAETKRGAKRYETAAERDAALEAWLAGRDGRAMPEGRAVRVRFVTVLG